MGCDIHMVAQVRVDGEWALLTHDEVRDYDEWDHDATNPFYREADVYSVHGGRYYERFALLVGVRNGGRDKQVVPMSAPRWYPPDFPVQVGDVAITPKGELWMGDHTYSWIDLLDFNQYGDDVPIPLQALHDGLLHAQKKYNVNCVNVRYVFGFDN